MSLEDCHDKNYVKTRAYHEGLKILTEQSIIGIIGAAGDGKSILCKIIAHQFTKQNNEYVPLIINNPGEFKEIPFVEGSKYLLITDNIFGNTLDFKNKLDGWEELFDQLRILTGRGQLAIIYSMRDYISKTYKYKLDKYDIFDENSKYIYLYSSEFCLNDEEKANILTFYKLSEKNKEVLEMITMSKNCFGFPAIACFYSKAKGNDRLSIFNSVTEFLFSEIQFFWQEDKDIYTALLLIFCLQPIFDDQLKSESLDRIINLKLKIKELYKDFEMAIAIDKCSYLSQTFIQFVETNLNRIYSLQEYVSEAFLKHISEKKMGMVLEYCPLQLLLSMTVITNSDDARQVVIKPEYYQLLSKRFLKEIQSGKNDVFDHPAFLNSEFLKTLLEQDFSGLVKTVDNINLGKIRNSEDRGNILHYIIVYGNVKCLRQLGSNDILPSCIRIETSSGNNCHGLSVMSSIEPLKKLQLLQEYDAQMPVDLPHMAVQSHDSEIIKYVAQKMNVATLLDSNTVLHSACNSDNDVNEIVTYILQNSQINVNDKNKDGFTALHLAARHGKHKTINYLLSQGASVDIQDNQGRLPLHLCVSTFTGRKNIDTFSIVSKLVESGSKIDQKDKTGHTPLYEAIHSLCTNDSIKLMISKIQTIEDMVLSEAALLLHADLFEVILRKYMNDHEKVSDKTVFNCCLSDKDTVEKLKLLQSFDTDFNVIDDKQLSPLHICCLFNSLSTVQYIVDKLGIEVNTNTEEGMTPLFTAVCSLIEPVAKCTFLLSHGASIDASLEEHSDLLHASCHCGLLEVVQFIVEELDWDVNVKDKTEVTPLHYSSISKIQPIQKIKYLTSHGAEIHDKDVDERSLLHYSCLLGELDVVHYVIDELGFDVSDKDKFDRVPLHFCTVSEIQPIEKIKYILQKGGSIHNKDIEGCNLLHTSCIFGQLEVVQYVIDNLGFNPNDKDMLDQGPLHHCSSSKIQPIEKIKLLIQKGSSVHDKDVYGFSVLHTSCYKGQLEVVQYVIGELRFDINDKNSKGKTAVFLSTISAIQPIEKIKYLTSRGASIYEKFTGFSLLDFSCFHGDLSVVKYFFDQFDKDVISLYLGTVMSKVQLVEKMRWLSEKGLFKELNSGMLIAMSSESGKLDSVKYLVDVEGLDVNSVYPANETPLLAASRSKIDRLEKIGFLISRGGLIIICRPYKDYFSNEKAKLLQDACLEGSLAAVKYLVDVEGLEVNGHGPDDIQTPLLAACQSNIDRLEKIGFLISKGGKILICRLY